MEDAQVFLKESGFESNELPGLGVLIALWLIVFQIIEHLLSPAMPELVQATLASDSLLLVLAALFSVFTYNLGSLWDDTFFDPRYQAPSISQNRPGGTWLEKKWYHLWIFPTANNLVRSRREVAGPLRGVGYTEVENEGEHAYTPAKKILIQNNRWSEVRGLLNWSKVFRSSVLPLFLIATFYGSLITPSLLFDRTSIPKISLSIAIGALLISACFCTRICCLVTRYMVNNTDVDEREKKKKGQNARIIVPILFLVTAIPGFLVGFFVPISHLPTWVGIPWIVLSITLGSMILAVIGLSISIHLRVNHIIEMYNRTKEELAVIYAGTAAPGGTTELGVRLLPGGAGASFRVWAPNASAVNVRLTPSNVNPFQTFPLSRDAAGQAYWSVDIRGVAVGHLYQFEITNRGGGRYNPGGLPFLRVDPCARQVTSSDPTLPAIVVDPTTFAFTSPFRTPSFENFIIYQAHVGSFAGRDDGILVSTDSNGGTANFAQFELKLDYIRSMNFNAVQFLPTGEYRGSEGEAYNPSNYYAPEVLYGSPDDLRRLVDACHRRGLAVFLDVVYNHMDATHNLWQFDGNTDRRTNESDPRTGGGIYFSTVETGFGRRPDQDSPDVQRFFIENATMWFNEYRVDGLRFDSAVNFSAGGLRAIVQKLIAAFPDKFIYAEDSDPNYIFNTIGFRACWDMGSADNFARIIGSGDIYGLQNLIGRFSYPTAYSAIKYLLGSHDQIFNKWFYDDPNRVGRWDKPGGGSLRENRYFVEKIGGPVTGRNNWYARAQARMGWALNVAMPCTPMLFMGSECYHYGYWNPENDAYGDHRFDWNIAGDSIGWEMRGMVRDVNAVRWNHPALRSDIPPLSPHFDAQNRVLAFQRWNNAGDVILIVVNLSDNQWNDPIYGVNVGGTGDRWTEIFNSQAPQYGGWPNSGNYLADIYVGADGQFRIRLPQWSVLMFQKN